jgi:hypothetical protein
MRDNRAVLQIVACVTAISAVGLIVAMLLGELELVVMESLVLIGLGWMMWKLRQGSS